MGKENKRKLFISNKKVNIINMVDQNYLNNGGHDEFMVIKIDGYKSRPDKFCVIEYDIYGKTNSRILTKEGLKNEFGEEVLNIK